MNPSLFRTIVTIGGIVFALVGVIVGVLDI